MKYHLILNPASAGGKTRKREEEIRATVRKHLGECSIALTKGPRHAEELCRMALREGADAILVAGGDGTINEVVNGCFEKALPTDVAPCGFGC